MATKFPKFSQSLAQDPATRRIWYGIATAHDLEAHDSMTEETLYQKIFASHFCFYVCSLRVPPLVMGAQAETSPMAK